MDNLDCLGEIELPTKQINSQIMINVIEGRDYYKSHIDTYVVVEVPLYFRDKTATSKPSSSPSYFKTFIIDLPTSLLNNVLNTHITITVYEAHNVLSLTKTAVLGSVVIQISTIWSEPNKSFHNKWLTLIDYGKNDLGVRGYLKCDIVMFYESHLLNNLILSKPLSSTREYITFNKNDLFIPNGFKMATSHLAKYTIKLHRSEVIRYLYEEGPKWLSIDFGEAHETSILLNLKGTELNWNKKYSTINVYPPLCPIIIFKLILSGKIMASRVISMQDFIGEDGLPCFGPAFLHFTTLEAQQYFGRILLSVETELVPSEIESVERLQIDDIGSILDEDLMYIRIIIFGVILSVNQLHKNLTRSKSMTISMDYGEYNLVTESEKQLELINTQTPEYDVVGLENDFYKLLIEEDRKPCLFLVTNLPSTEYYTMFSMNLLSKTIVNMETCIFKTCRQLNYQQSSNSKIEIIHGMIKKLIVYLERFKQSYDKHIKLHKHIHTSCVNNMELFKQYCSKEIKTVMNLLTYTETDVFILVNRIKDTFDQLIICHKNKLYNGPPNIFLNLRNGKQILSRCQIQTRHFLYSKISECKGQFCKQIRPWFLATKKKENVFDGIMETIFWIGPYEDFNVGIRKIPGLLYNNCNDQPCSQYNFKLYDKTFLQIKAHVSQVALTEKCYKKYSRLHLMARIIFNGHSMTTEAIDSNVSTSWNVSILFKPILFTRYGDTNKRTPIYVIIQLCHIGTEKKELIEDVIAFTIINVKEIDNSSRKTLDWYDIVDSSEKIGKIYMAAEITQIVSNELTEIDNDLSVPLLKHVQPNLRVYQLVVLFWGLRQLNVHLHEPFVRLLCSTSSIDSDIIKNFNSFSNFPNMVDKKCVLSLELPEDPYLIPPISFQLFTKYIIKNSHTPLGICVSQSLDEFMVPSISKTQQNERPHYSILEMEEDKEETKSKIKKTIKKKINLKDNFKLYCNVIKQKCCSIFPTCLKNIISWIIEHTTCVLMLLYNAICYVLPCVNKITYWTSNNLKNYISYFGNKYDPLIDDELEEDEKEFSWWTKYYVFKYQKKTFQKNKHISVMLNIPSKLLPKKSNKTHMPKYYSKTKSTTIHLYDHELESVPEFNGFEDSLKKFKIYDFDKKDEKATVVAILKGNVHLYPMPVDNDEHGMSQEQIFSNTASQIWPGLKSNAKCNVIVRIYILRAYNLHPGDISGLSDPYVEIVLGKSIRISDRQNYVPKTLNPVFGRCFERVISFPECSMMNIRIMDYDRIGKNELIGETKIDIESRYFSKHRAHCGLPKQYNKDGYNRWRDSEKPSKILHNLCSLYSLKHPIYTTNSVTVGLKTFHVHDENTESDRQSLALYVLNHWQEMPVVGYHLVPEYVETRTLYNPDMPNLHQGTLEMWVDMFSKDSNIPEMVDIKPPTVELYELRVVIWSVTDVKLVDNNFFTKEKHSDIYIKGWLPGVEKRSTDVHYRSLNGEGLFNWRLKFLFPYNKTENIIVYRKKNFFGLDHEEQQFSPKLNLEIWDNDQLSPDLFIGSLTLNLRNMPRGAKSSWMSNLSDMSRINLFKVKKTSGWWPFISTENNKNTIVGKVNAEIQIMTKQEADKFPAGFGRDGPQPLTVPKRPSTHYLKTIMDPFKFVFRSLFSANKTKFLFVLSLVFVVLFFLIMIYAIPGNLIRILFDKLFKKV